MTRREAYLILNLITGIGPVRVRRLLQAFGSPEDALGANMDALVRVEGIGPEMAQRLAHWESAIDLGRELRRIDEVGAHVITQEDAGYPSTLREVFDAPIVLYIWGQLASQDDRGIAVVGSRRATHYGVQCARRLSFQLAHSGITVLSGLALGIDTAAHEGALAAGGRTVGVLGSGLGKFWPPENHALARRIANGQGAVVSEFPIDYNPDKQSFPLRNRIVAGWSQGVLCVEAPARSGSLITVNQAADYGRPIYAVPGPIDRPTSEGCNTLIQNGARLVMAAGDIIDDLGWLIPPDRPGRPESEAPAPIPPPDRAERAVVEALGHDERQFDELVAATGLPAGEVSVAVMKLEMKRLIHQLPGRYYRRNH
ncbi:MAG: DNA-processing protein DprA [Verrucomicrobiales bacterium]